MSLLLLPALLFLTRTEIRSIYICFSGQGAFQVASRFRRGSITARNASRALFRQQYCLKQFVCKSIVLNAIYVNGYWASLLLAQQLRQEQKANVASCK